MENLQYFILEEIYLRYSSRTGTELKRFIKEKLGKEPSDLEFTRDIKAVLDDLEEMKMIIWDAGPMKDKGKGFPESEKYKNLLGSTHDDKKQTFENIYVEVKLTKNLGFDYAAKIVNGSIIRESIVETNKSTQKLNDIILPQNFRIQKNLTLVAVVVAGASFLAVLASVYYTPKSVTSEEVKHLDSIFQATSKLLDSMRLSQKGIDLSLRTAINDSTKIFLIGTKHK